MRCDVSPSLPCRPQRESSAVLLAHVTVFLKRLYPIMPVFDSSQVVKDCEQVETLSRSRYAFLLALCAATHLQLNLDVKQDHGVLQYSEHGRVLVAEALRALQEFDPIENLQIDSVLSSFFLFSAYGNMDQQDHAWFYLSQSISYAYALNLHREQTYASLPSAEAELRRRVFWLLFITERAYALQRGKPVMLRGSIRKPAIFTSAAPALLYGFVNLINVFEKVTPEFYHWNSCNGGGSMDIYALSDIYQSLAIPLPPLAEIPETQQVDLVVTQQWLQIRLWQTITDHPSNCEEVLPLQAPAAAGRAVMSFLASVSHESSDAHGIGIEQKLYDLGSSLVHFTQRSLPRTTAQLGYVTANVAELLFTILTSLGRIRGAQSYLFSSLLEKSESILGLDAIPQEMTLDMPLALDCHSRFGEWKTMLDNHPVADKHEETVYHIENPASGRSFGIP
ncbi:transcriptional regulator family: Fungal Specific TF [Penicillium atrosanguineum]|uniref:Transcriptional regulator family: Fungal Specific TF n=1 Tax=Penicillium atrosanguineum TaxID=1132637 RepID=A0A9W9PP11_9EURO|nr:transcriptional regulator family: Fungal Specific TF [Penicillium atrosanguineum]